MTKHIYTAESLEGISPAHTAHLLTNLSNQRDQLLEHLYLILFAVTIDAENNGGNVDRKAVQEIVAAALNSSVVAA